MGTIEVEYIRNGEAGTVLSLFPDPSLV